MQFYNSEKLSKLSVLFFFRSPVNFAVRTEID